jgi:Zn finger protein HypA/HybF involved in hydrogenase expression
MTMKLIIEKLKCLRCNHEWVPRQEDVRICPKCKSAYWNKEKKKNVDTGESKGAV